LHALLSTSPPPYV
jgi:hypothetical protein